MAQTAVDVVVRTLGLSKLVQLDKTLKGTAASAVKAGQGVDQLTGKLTKSGQQIRKAANGLEYFIDATGRARKVNGQFVTTAEAAAAGITGVGKSASKAGVGVKAFGTAIKTALGPIGLALAGISSLTAAFRTIAGQDFSVAKVESLGVNSQVLVEELKLVSKELKGNASVAELTAAAYDVASAGFTDAADAAKVLKAASQGATGGFSDINTVGDAATSVLNAYGKSADEAAKLIDGFIQTQNDGKIVVNQYAQNIGKVASAAAGLQVPIEEVNAAIAQSTAAGVQAEVAFTGLKGALARLASGEATKALKGTGIEIDAATVAADGLLGTLRKLQGLDTGQILKALGTEAGPALLPVIQNLERFEELLENQENAAGAAARAQQQAAQTINGAWNRVRVAIENLFTDQAALAKAIIPILDAVANAIDGVTFATKQFNSIASEVKGTVDSLGKALPQLAEQFGGLGKAIAFAVQQLGLLLLRADGFDAANKSGFGKGLRNFGANYKEQEAALFAAASESRVDLTTKNQTEIPDFSPLLSGGSSSGGAKSAGKERKSRVPELQRELDLALQLEELQGKINAAELAGNDQLKIRLEGEARMFELMKKESDILASDIPDAEKQLELLRLGVEVRMQALDTEQQLALLAQGELEARQNALAPLEEQRTYLEDILSYGEDEADIRREINRIMESTPGLDKDRVEELVRGNQALQERIDKFNEMKAQVTAVASTISSAFTSAFRSVIDGSKSAQEALSDAFTQIGNSFVDMALKIIEQQLTMIMQGLLMKALGISMPGSGAGLPSGGGFGSGAPQLFTGGDIFNAPFKRFADGGIPPVGKPSIVGEEGPEIFIPQERGLVLPNDIFEATKEALETNGEVVPAEEAEQTEAALAANNSNISNTYNTTTTTNSAAAEEAKALERNKESINATLAKTEIQSALEQNSKSIKNVSYKNETSVNEAFAINNNSIQSQKQAATATLERESMQQMMDTPSKLTVAYESTVINQQEYVTAEQHQKGVTQAAMKGRDMALASLKNSVRARKQVGLA